MTAFSVIINIVLILISIILIVVVLMQQGQRQGLGAIGGGAETFLGKNKAKSLDGKLHTITKIAAAAFIVLAIVATILSSHMATEEPTTQEALTELQQMLDEQGTATADPAAEATDAVTADATDVVADATDEVPAEATEAPVEVTEAPAEEPAA